MASAYGNKLIDLGAVSCWMLGDDGAGALDLTDTIGTNDLTLTSGTGTIVDSPNIVGSPKAFQIDGSTWLNKATPTGIDLGLAHSFVGYIKQSTLDSGWGWVWSTLSTSKFLGMQRRSGFFSTRGEMDGGNHGRRSTITTVDEQWYHFAHTYNGTGTSTLYVDGVDVTSTTEGSANVSDSAMFTIGARDSGGVAAWTGEMQGLAVFQAELTSGQVGEIIAAAAQSLGPQRSTDRAIRRAIDRSI